MKRIAINLDNSSSYKQWSENKLLYINNFIADEIIDHKLKEIENKEEHDASFVIYEALVYCCFKYETEEDDEIVALILGDEERSKNVIASLLEIKDDFDIKCYVNKPEYIEELIL